VPKLWANNTDDCKILRVGRISARLSRFINEFGAI